MNQWFEFQSIQNVRFKSNSFQRFPSIGIKVNGGRKRTESRQHQIKYFTVKMIDSFSVGRWIWAYFQWKCKQAGNIFGSLSTGPYRRVPSKRNALTLICSIYIFFSSSSPSSSLYLSLILSVFLCSLDFLFAFELVCIIETNRTFNSALTCSFQYRRTPSPFY